ncbi:MAG: hypothetical protein LIP08_00505 [Bacteroides sp.]|nr:hypothetical protein [Bacteroides sp.]
MEQYLEYIKISASLLGGGAIGAIITAIITERSNRIQPVEINREVTSPDLFEYILLSQWLTHIKKFIGPIFGVYTFRPYTEGLVTRITYAFEPGIYLSFENFIIFIFVWSGNFIEIHRFTGLKLCVHVTSMGKFLL